MAARRAVRHTRGKMGLQIDIGDLVGPGRRKLPLEAEYVRELSDADLGILAVTDRETIPAPIKRITERHHMVARLLAAGTSPGEVSALTGYDNSRISVLQNSPAMQELIALYRAEVNTQFAHTLDHLAGLSKDAILELRLRLEEEPEEFSVKELKDVAELALDRTGYGKATTVNSNVNVSLAARLETARARAKAISHGQIIDAEVIEPE